MNQKPSTVIPSSSQRANWITKLITRLTTEGESKHPGVLMRGEQAGIDDGGGYSGEFDGRPDFVRKDDEGWQRLT